MKERETQKKAKYRELAADLANQGPNYRVQNTAVVIGILGLVVGTRKEILTTGLCERAEVRLLVQAMQASTLKAATRIIRRHMKVNHEARTKRRKPPHPLDP